MVIHKPCTCFVDTETVGSNRLMLSAFSSAELHGVDSERLLGEGRFAVDICFHPLGSVEGYPASHNQLSCLLLLRCQPQFIS